jgi:hypothetical protein
LLVAQEDPPEAEHSSPKPEATASGHGDNWFVRSQAVDGSYAGPDGNADVGATSLVALAFLGDGTTLHSGPEPFRATLTKAVNWLVGHQRDNGAFEAAGPGSTRRLAQATYALVETAGLSNERGPVRAAADKAIAALFAARLADGGWSDGSPDAASDAVSTAWTTKVVASAGFFDFDLPVAAKELVAWFDQHEGTGTEQLAAELLVRYLAGQDPTTTPALTRAADVVSANADARSPATAYWVSYALFQGGGEPWRKWQPRLKDAIITTQVTDPVERGSWDPVDGLGRATTTALNVLTLEVYYRYSRLVK